MGQKFEIVDDIYGSISPLDQKSRADTVWLVMTGHWSTMDEIRGVFSSRAKAIDFVRSSQGIISNAKDSNGFEVRITETEINKGHGEL